MAVRLADKIKQLGTGSYALVDAIDVEMADGTRLEDAIESIEESIPTKTSDITNDSNFVSDANYVHTDNNFTTAEKTKLGGVEANAEVNVVETIKVNNVAQTVTDKSVNITVPTKTSDLTNDAGFITDGDIPSKLSDLEEDSTHRVVTDAEKASWNAKADVSDIPTKLSDLTNDSDFVEDANYVHTDNNYTSADKSLVTNAIQSSEKGANNGVAELGSDGKIPSSQLPSYVDDVLEYDTASDFPSVGESGKIYIALDTNLTYRWGGTEYVAIASDLALGETASTAYRGDRGKIAYEHATDPNKVSSAVTSGMYKIGVTSEGHISDTTSVTKQDIVALGIPAQDTTYSDATTTDSGLMSATDKTKLDGVEAGANNYVLPKATTSSLGGVKPDGSTITVDADGTIHGASSIAELNDIGDVNISNPQDGQSLVYDATNEEWVNSQGTSQIDELNDIGDVDITTPTNGQALVYNSTTENWENGTVSTVEIDDTTTSQTKVWSSDKVSSELANKVDVVSGKQLSTEDYTTAEKTKLSGIEDNANNYTLPTASTSTLGGVKVDGTSIIADENGVISSNSSGLTQYTSMPTPSAQYVGKVVQFIGNTSGDYKKDHFYRGILESVEHIVDYYAWVHRGDSGGGGYSHVDVYTKTLTPSQTSEIFTNKACTIVSTDTFSQLRLDYYGQGINRLDIYNSGSRLTYYMGYDASKSSERDVYHYAWVEAEIVDGVIDDSASSTTTTYSSNKLDTSLASKLNANMTWEGTHAEYEAVKDTIPVGATVIFTDDDQGVTYLDEQYDVLNNAYDIVHNTSNNALAGANGVKAMNTYSTSETIVGTWLDGKPIYRRKITGTTATPASNGTWTNCYINFDHDVDVFVKSYGSLVDNDGNTISIPMVHTNNRLLELYPNKANKQVNLVNTSVNWGGKTATIFIEYTKTTD